MLGCWFKHHIKFIHELLEENLFFSPCGGAQTEQEVERTLFIQSFFFLMNTGS
tara:strand:- start:1552 stop:1710 length:159 start_codon:yes stop_codon:yes gene_type:complete